MKFTKEDAFESLKRELTNNGRKTLRMSERSLNGISEILISKLANDETGLPDFVADVKEILEICNGNVGKDVSDHVKKLDAEYSQKSESQTEEKATENPEMKALLERIAALEADKEASAKKASIEQKRKDFVAKLKEKGVKDEEWINDFLTEVNIDESFDVDAKAETWLTRYNKYKASGGNPAVSGNPSGAATASEYEKSIKAASEMAKRERAVIEQK